MMNNLNPKAKTLTAAQAQHMLAAENCNIRARIIELGVKDFLAEASYSDATEAARDMLTEAVAMRKMARTHMDQAADPQRGQRVPKHRAAAKSSKRPGSRASRR